MKISWKTIKETVNEKISRHICVGKCSVNTRSHFATKNGFSATHIGFNKNGKAMYKGLCGGHPLNRQVVEDSSDSNGEYRAPLEWVPIEDANLALQRELKARAERRAATLARFSEVRVKMSSKAPKRVIRDFDRAIRHQQWMDARDIARRYGCY
jgi:hypothetical protein